MSFQQATRQNFTELPAQPFVSGGRLYFELPKVGLLSRLILQLSGVMTVTLSGGTAAISERLAYNLIKRVRLIANSGASIFDVSGYGTYAINRLLRYDSSPQDSLIDHGTKALAYQAGVTAGANNWNFGLEIPIAVNERDPLGLILLQNQASQLVLEIEFNSEYSLDAMLAPVLVTGAATASFVGKVGAMMEYFTVPRNVEDYPALNVIHQWIEQRDSVTSVGAWTKNLQRGNTYQRIVHALTVNKALNSAAVEKLRLIYNQAETPYNVNALTQAFLQRSRYGSDLPKGMFVHDFTMSNGLPSLGNARDFIRSAGVTEFQSEVTIASGTSMTAGQCFIDTLTEQLITIE